MKPPLLMLLMLLPGVPTLAQNSDLGIMFAISRTNFNFGAFSRTEYRLGLQGNYAWQITENAKGRLYLELPLNSADALFFTPGLRYHLNLTPRVAVYAAAGVGIASRRATISDFTFDATGALSHANFHSEQRITGAYDVGAGIDFRLTRMLSLRSEVRRFRADAQTGLPIGRTFPSGQFGLALHF